MSRIARHSAQLPRTRILILSDTHGIDFTAYHGLRGLSADLAIHCGDLTKHSKLDEFRTTVRAMEALDIPTKLAIAGNHEVTLDEALVKKKMANVEQDNQVERIQREFGKPGDAKKLFDDARKAGVVLLDEGIHRLQLANGASVTIFASPFIPSRVDWAFRYDPQQGHKFVIEKDTDIVITHVPPRGVVDKTHLAMSIGSPELMASVREAKPRLHCFGHVHEGRGLGYMTWENEGGSSLPTGSLGFKLFHGKGMNEDEWDQTQQINFETRSFYHTSHCSEDTRPVQKSAQTWFVNAGMKGDEMVLLRRPWLLDIGLPMVSRARP